jgi:PAS domain-containing protein
MKNPKFLFSRIHPDDFKIVMKPILEANHDKASWSIDFRALNSKNEIVWVNGNSYRIADQNGNVVHNRVLHDIIRQKDAEEALQKSEQQNLNIADNIPGVVLKYKLNSEGNDELLYISKGVADLYEFDAGLAIKDNQILWNRVHKDDLEGYISSVKESAKKPLPMDL